MYCRILTLFLQFAAVYSAPLLQALYPMHQENSMQTSQRMLQQQLLELQELQGLQQMVAMNFGQQRLPPVYILLTNSQTDNTKTNEQTKHEATELKHHMDKEIVDDDLDSVIIESDSNQTEGEPQRALLLLPNYARLSIGDIISAIPFLPIEINVTDTIGWAYNGISSGISGIISIIGQRLPFVSKPTQGPSQEIRLKSVLQRLQMKKQNNFPPIIIMPIVPQLIPMRLPIQV